MAKFVLSSGSLAYLDGVDDNLVRVVHKALSISKVDFSVIDGVRSLAQQRKYVDTGKSHTMDSRHLTGHAVDLAAWVDGSSFKDEHMFMVAEAMRSATSILMVPLRWGGAWQIHDVRKYETSMKYAHESYKRERAAYGLDYLKDLPHFEIPA